MNLANNLFKSSLLAFVIFWSIIISNEGFDADMSLFFIFSFIPILLCVAVIVITTIYSIFWTVTTKTRTPKTVFKRFFPYYAIIAFSIIAYGIISSDFNVFAIAFFTSAFITVCQSWVWFAKTDTI